MRPLNPWLIFLLSLAPIFSAHADSVETQNRQTKYNPLALLKQHGINAGGWLALGTTVVPEQLEQHNNTPISFNDQSSVVQLNQLNLFLERLVDREAKDWHVGGRVDALFGTDSRFTQAKGLDNHWLSHQGLGQYDFALPQAYLEVSAPFGSGVTAKIGHFYTIIGHEVVTSPNNFFYSHAYTMQYGEPFTHTGALFSYALNSNYTVNAGAVTGWDTFDQNNGHWNFLGDISWTDDAASTSVSWGVISGDTGMVTPANRTLSSLVLSHSFTDKLQYVFQHDFGFQEKSGNFQQPAYWYGINQYLFYEFTDEITAGVRGEWFRDNNGTRLNIGSPGNYLALTAGINWKPASWLSFRPECRYDWSDSLVKAYATNRQNHQFEIAVDMLITF